MPIPPIISWATPERSVTNRNMNVVSLLYVTGNKLTGDPKRNTKNIIKKDESDHTVMLARETLFR